MDIERDASRSEEGWVLLSKMEMKALMQCESVSIKDGEKEITIDSGFFAHFKFQPIKPDVTAMYYVNAVKAQKEHERLVKVAKEEEKKKKNGN